MLDPELVPDELRDRVLPVSLLPLTASDVAAVLASRRPGAAPASADDRLRHLVALGLPRSRIAHDLGLSARTLDRRLRELRTELGAETLAQAASALATLGYGRQPGG